MNRQEILRRARFFILALAGCLISMAISYGMVRMMTRNVSMVPRVDSRTWNRAVRLRRWTVEMNRITEDWKKQVADTNKNISPEAGQWLHTRLMPQLSRLREELATAEGREESTLRAAVARLSAMAAHPGDTALRQQALAEAQRAVTAAETWIADHGGGRNLPQPSPLRSTDVN